MSDNEKSGSKVYRATEKKDSQGRTIYHKIMKGRGRPPQFILKGGKYIALHGWGV